jgi:hypothetical protein
MMMTGRHSTRTMLLLTFDKFDASSYECAPREQAERRRRGAGWRRKKVMLNRNWSMKEMVARAVKTRSAGEKRIASVKKH